MGCKNLKIVHINVNHCLAAFLEVFRTAREVEIDIIAVQEPYLIEGVPPKALFGCGSFYSQKRNAILYIFYRDLNVYFKHSTPNTVCLEFHFKDFILNIFSCYFPPHDSIDTQLEKFDGFNFSASYNLILGDMPSYQLGLRLGH